MQVVRQEAHDRLAWVVAGARAGAGRALVVLGEPGAGKSTALALALERADDAVVLRTTGVPVEQSLPHAGLHALLRPLAPLLPELPGVQRSALDVVLGLAPGPAPSPFVVGAATLTLLAAQAEQATVLVVVDDAQWVDAASLQAVAFAGRRLAGERVGLLVAARSGEVPPALEGLERLVLGPLTADDARCLVPELAPQVAAALVEATGGNALALVERARGLDSAQRRGDASLPAADRPLFAQEVAGLPPAALEAAALVALAEDVPPAVLAAARPPSLVPAEDAGLLVATAGGVRWRHPLARAAVLDALPPRRLRALSARLAEAAARAGAPDAVVVELRLAAVEGPEEGLAQDLERVAAAAADSGDHERSARLWARAADVGTDAGRHGPRLFEAAQELLAAGRLADARAHYRLAGEAGLDDLPSALTHLALGRIEHTAGSPLRALHELEAAATRAPTAALRLRALGEGVAAAMYAGAPEVAAALARRALEEPDVGDPAARLVLLHVRGAAAALQGDLETARPLLAELVAEAGRSDVLSRHPELVMWVLTAELFRGGTSDLGLDVAAPAVEQLRLRGDLTWLPRVVRMWGVRQELAGRWQAAHATYEEAVELSRAAGQSTQLVEALSVLALTEAVRGERDACLAHAEEAEQLLARLDVPFLSSSAWQARGLLHLALDEPAAAAAALAPAAALPPGVHLREPLVSDLVEALVLDGRREEAERAAATAPSARSAGVLARDDGEAVRLLLSAADEAGDLLTAARCRLLAGERLRRAGLRLEARGHLRAAAAVFAQAGAAPWRRRAEEGLRASGEALSSRDESAEALTGAELRVAALVAEGRPTREVAALLFLSPKTVEFHLGRIYRKLGVRGRAELARRLAPSGP